MKTKLALSAVAAAIAVFSQGAFAQASAPSKLRPTAPTSRPAPKPSPSPPPVRSRRRTRPTTSDKTRDERKAQTKADEKSGNIEPAGEAGGQKEDKAMKTHQARKPPVTARKEKTKAQQKNKEIPAGWRRRLRGQASSKRSSPIEKRLFGAAFFWLPALRPSRRGPRGCRAPRLRTSPPCRAGTARSP